MTIHRAIYLLLTVAVSPIVGALTDSGDISGPFAIALPFAVSGAVAVLAEMASAVRVARAERLARARLQQIENLAAALNYQRGTNDEPGR